MSTSGEMARWAGLVLLACFGCGRSSPADVAGEQCVPIGAPSPFAAPQDVACRRDSDCVITYGSCCACGSGGAQGAVNRAALDAVLARRHEMCSGDRICLPYTACETDRAACVAGQCTLCEPGPE